MAAPKGNQHAKGNKGGGRKSAYQELADATEAYKLLFEEQDQEELEKKITSGKFAVVDRIKLTAMEGDSNVMLGIMKKALPEISKIDHTTKGKELPAPILNALPSNDSASQDTEAKKEA